MTLEHVRRRMATVGLATLVAAGTIAAAAPAQASPSHSSAQPSPPVTKAYSERDVVDMFAFGSGPVAQQHPEAVVALFGRAPRTAPSPNVVDELTTRLKAIDPAFDTRVLPGLTSHDPMRTQSALVHFASDTRQVVQPASTGADQAARPNDIFYEQSNVVVDAQVAQSLSVVTSVIAALEVFGTIVLTYRHSDSSGELQQGQAISTVANAFA